MIDKGAIIRYPYPQFADRRIAFNNLGSIMSDIGNPIRDPLWTGLSIAAGFRL